MKRKDKFNLELRKLKRRIAYFNKKSDNGLFDYGLPTNTKELNKLKRSFEKEQKKIRLQKRLNRFKEKIENYNKSVGLSRLTTKYLYFPRTEKELIKHRKIFKLVEERKIKKAKEQLAKTFKRKLTKDITISALTSQNEGKYRRKHKIPYTYRDELYYKNTLIIAKVNNPELFAVLEEGGIDFVLALYRGRFSIDDIGESDPHAFDELDLEEYTAKIGRLMKIALKNDGKWNEYKHLHEKYLDLVDEDRKKNKKKKRKTSKK